MSLFMDCLYAFLVGGFICLIGQFLIDYTRLTPARILVCYVVGGVVLTALGLYEPIVEFAGAGATVPLTGFGYSLAMGVKEAVEQYGIIGALMGGLTATSAGIAASVFAGFIMALIFKPGDKT
ncbi:MAG: stage V sporulation protein AE [Acutalibacteraceae bacterium]|nr:stage V sporulation protein AE [Acutalibacteraceae bacterium]